MHQWLGYRAGCLSAVQPRRTDVPCEQLTGNVLSHLADQSRDRLGGGARMNSQNTMINRGAHRSCISWRRDRSLRSSRARHVWALAGIAVLAMSVATPAFATSAHRGMSHKASVKPDFNYYIGKTITFVSPGAPGGSYDGLARILAPAIGSYLHCTVIVEDLSSGGGIAGQNDVAASAPNGLTIGELNPDGDVENFLEGTSALTFSLKKQNYIAGVPAVNIVWMSDPQSEYHSIVQIIKPKGPLHILDVTSGYQDLLDRVLIGAYGIPSSSLISGFNGSPALLAGFINKDGPIANIGLQAVESYIAAGLARPLMLTLPMKPGNLGYAFLHKLHLPTYTTILNEHPPKTAAGRKALKELVDISTSAGQIVFTPAGTPMSLNLALTAAMRSALHQTSIKALEDAQGLSTGYISPLQVAKDLNKVLRNSATIAPFLPHL